MRKKRIYAKNPPRLPMPNLTTKNDHGFALKMLSQADQRHAAVKMMRRRIETLMEETDSDSLAKEMLCARAAYLIGYIESQELAGLEEGYSNMQRYLQAVKALSDLLGKLGLEKAAAVGQRLEQYLVVNGTNGKKKSRK